MDLLLFDRVSCLRIKRKACDRGQGEKQREKDKQVTHKDF